MIQNIRASQADGQCESLYLLVNTATKPTKTKTRKMADRDYEDSGFKLRRFKPTDIESCASEWEEYKRQFLIHLDSKGLHDAAGRRKVGQLLKHMGPDHVNTYDSFIWNEAIEAVQAYYQEY